MPRRSGKPEQYNQLGIGDCGHVVHTWPQVRERGGKTRVLCIDCGKKEYGVDSTVEVTVYLRHEDIHEKPKPPPKPKAAPRAPRKTAMRKLLEQEGLW